MRFNILNNDFGQHMKKVIFQCFRCLSYPVCGCFSFIQSCICCVVFYIWASTFLRSFFSKNQLQSFWSATKNHYSLVTEYLSFCIFSKTTTQRVILYIRYSSQLYKLFISNRMTSFAAFPTTDIIAKVTKIRS